MKTMVVKLGGSTLGEHDSILDDLVELQRRGVSLVVVHGGGNRVTRWLKRSGIPTRFMRGLRVTDAATLEIVVAVLAGLVNKELVTAIEARGGKALGLCGGDGGFIRAVPQSVDLGYVGKVTRVEPHLLRVILEGGYMPLIAPLSFYPGDKRTGAETSRSSYPGLLNVNGDTVAGEIAAALRAEKLVFLTDVSGVCDSSGKLIPELTSQEAERLLSSGIASEGMIPKIEACCRALDRVPQAHIIDGRVPHILMLIQEGEGKEVGTTIIS